MPAFAVEFLLHEIGEEQLPRSRDSREPDDGGLLPFDRRVRLLVDFNGSPIHGGRTPQSFADHPGTNRIVRDAVDEDEAARVSILDVRIEGDRAIQLEFADADLVEVELVRRGVLQCVDVDLVAIGSTVAVTVFGPIFRK